MKTIIVSSPEHSKIITLMAANKYSRAINLLEKLALKDRYNKITQLLLYKCYNTVENHPKAFKVLEKLVRLKVFTHLAIENYLFKHGFKIFDPYANC
jgi:tetratricopeptide (TPR) repeat protein